MKPVDLTRAIPDFYNTDLRTILYYVNMIRLFNYSGSKTLVDHVVNLHIYLFTGNRDTLLPDFNANSDCCKNLLLKRFHIFILMVTISVGMRMARMRSFWRSLKSA